MSGWGRSLDHRVHGKVIVLSHGKYVEVPK